MEVRSMFWYKQANLAFDLEKLFMDRFFAAVCTCTCGHAQVVHVRQQGFGLNLSANQIAGFCIPS